MQADEINRLFGIDESFMLPDKLMQLLFSDLIEDIYEKYIELQKDLAYDGFTNYFQEEHSSRKAMMQDFTPKELSELVAKIAGGECSSCLDICAGTGGLTIALHNIAPECIFYCEELSQRAVPLLLFNLAVRNIDAFVSNKNVLTGEIVQNYRVRKCGKFGKIEKIGEIPNIPVDVCVTNPPYSLKWEYDEKQKDERFAEFGYPPKQFADLGFIIHGMSRLNEDKGRIIAILPHGVLFRGNKEAEIRRKMLEKGLVKSIIGLPDKLFLNTDIPVAIMEFCKQPSEQIIFIDASREFEKNKKKNRLTNENIKKILFALQNNTEIKKYSHMADMAEIRVNEFNLNISRYVDMYEPPPKIDIVSVSKASSIKSQNKSCSLQTGHFPERTCSM